MTYNKNLLSKDKEAEKQFAKGREKIINKIRLRGDIDNKVSKQIMVHLYMRENRNSAK